MEDQGKNLYLYYILSFCLLCAKHRLKAMLRSAFSFVCPCSLVRHTERDWQYSKVTKQPLCNNQPNFWRLNCVFIFYCCIISEHKLTGLQQHTLIISQPPSVRSLSLVCLPVRSALGFTRLWWMCQSGLESYLRLGVLFQVPMVVRRIHFLAAREFWWLLFQGQYENLLPLDPFKGLTWLREVWGLLINLNSAD